MADPQEIGRVALDALYAVIDELNPELPDDKQIAKDRATPLFGSDDGLESIDLVRLIVLYELEIANATDRTVSISDDRAMSDTQSHFGTVGALADYAAGLIAEEGGIG